MPLTPMKSLSLSLQCLFLDASSDGNVFCLILYMCLIRNLELQRAALDTYQ